MLRTEFVGRSMLELEHARLIVRLRRRIDPEADYPAFERMWREEREFLLEELDMRWLVSAADTMTDFSQDRSEAAIALGVSLLVNTVKLYETEHICIGSPPRKPSPQGLTGRINLFDGVTAFTVGRGDMIYNLALRCRDAAASGSIAGALLWEVFRRTHQHDTVYRRMLDRNRSAEWCWRGLVDVGRNACELSDQPDCGRGSPWRRWNPAGRTSRLVQRVRRFHLRRP